MSGFRRVPLPAASTTPLMAHLHPSNALEPQYIDSHGRYQSSSDWWRWLFRI